MKKKCKAKKNKRKKNLIQNEGYLNELKEWQEHQYDPGYYTGGTIPPMYTNPGKPTWLGWIFIVFSVTGFITVVTIPNSFRKNQLFEMISILSIFLFLSVLHFIAGIRLINKGRRKKFSIKRKTAKSSARFSKYNK